MTEPCDTLSPTLTSISSISPSSGQGTSIVALSVSSVIKPSSAETESPLETRISIISTSSSSPMSGTSTSMTLLSPEDFFGSEDSFFSSLSSSFDSDAFSSSLSSDLSSFSSDFSSSVSSSSSEESESPAASTIASTSPSLMVSPTFTFSSTILPPEDAGISIDALSLSTVTIPSSCSTVSPLLTRISMTSTSSPPTSGTLSSI